MNSQQDSSKNNTMKYATIGTSWLITLGVAVWLGIKIDEWTKLNPLFTILLPTAAVISLLWQIIKEFSKPKK